MKQLLAIVSIAFALSLTSCADRMSDRHSEMKGGQQGPPPANFRDDKQTPITSANSDGAARPIAGGKQTTTADTMWNQSAPADQKPF